MLCAGCIRSDKRNVDVCGCGGGQLDLCLFCGILQTLYSHLIGRKVNAFGLLELFNHPVDNSLVEVIAAQAVVACGSQYLLYAVAHLNDGNIERTAAQVVYHNSLVVFLINAIRKRSCGRLVDDTLYGQTCDLSCVLGCLTLRVGEVRGDGDDRLGDGLAQIGLGVALQLLQDHGADLLRGEALAVNGNALITAHFALNAGNGARCVGDSLAFGRIAHKAFAAFCKSNDRRGGALAFGIGDNGWASAFHHSHAAVGCS